MADFVLAIDCGSHAVRSIAFNVETGEAVSCGCEDLSLDFPQPGWVEIDGNAVVKKTVQVIQQAQDLLDSQGHTITALGLTNMRETAFLWDRQTGEPVAPGIMWMSGQSAPVVERWRSEGLDSLIRERTGLANETFFFGSKLAWLLEQRPDLADRARSGELAAGTLDSWLLYALSGGAAHLTDVSNGSRYQLMDLRTLEWDPELAERLGIPLACLPTLCRSMGELAHTDAKVCGAEIPITGLIADQQASLLGHGCESAGAIKATFGTSGVVSLNTGGDIVLREGLVTSVGWTDAHGVTSYEIEGSAFHSGYTVAWIDQFTGSTTDRSAPMGPSPLPAEDRVYVLPSFSGMGAPRWPSRRGAVIAGLAMDTVASDVVRAATEAMAFQAYDLLLAMEDALADGRSGRIVVDGGGASSDYLCRLLAALTGDEVVRPRIQELTSLGAAKAALRGGGVEAPVDFGHRVSDASRFFPEADLAEYGRAGFVRWTELIDNNLC